MKWKLCTKSSSAGEDAGKTEWVNLAHFVSVYSDEEGSWCVVNDDTGTLYGPYVESPEAVLA